MSQTPPESSLPLGPATVAGVEVITIPLVEYSALLAARARLAKVGPGGSRRPGSPIEKDVEMRDFLLARLGRMELDKVRAACLAELGRAPSRSALHRFDQRHRADPHAPPAPENA